ncbi:MAG: hypothetical protein M1816_000174 [Peltula sp. TS41687]|nr:MAG: hypothetical protein M1816_000174 [Peltula sp. TS41687]
MARNALSIKEEGNKRFNAADYKGAESLYTQAITLDPTNPTLYNNRAFARLKLSAWDLVISDCLESIRLESVNMKGYYYLAQAQMALNHPNEALSSALTAYEFCIQTGNASAASISALILKAKKAKWEARERERLRRQDALLRELEERLDAARLTERKAIEHDLRSGRVERTQADEESEIVEDMTRKKLDELRNVFAIAKPLALQRREVPDYLIDNISFSIMHDPVVTKTGQSYDRATILEHLRRSETDPLTREPLRKEDLRPNLALKQACAEFLEENGWAVDW